LRKFIEEPKEQEDEFSASKNRGIGHLTYPLLVTSVIGFVLQLLTVFYPTSRLEMIYPSLSWAFACLMVAIYRPISTPGSLLVVYVSILVSQMIILLDSTSDLGAEDFPAVFILLSSVGAILIILLMPMRDPCLSSRDISPAFSPPTLELRTPEDNLSLWQWMTVSWMAPLISIQHRKLHDRFRQLQGPVLNRLLEANGIDLFIISMLAIVEEFASKFLTLDITLHSKLY
jgi:hypothetical protein